MQNGLMSQRFSQGGFVKIEHTRKDVPDVVKYCCGDWVWPMGMWHAKWKVKEIKQLPFMISWNCTWFSHTNSALQCSNKCVISPLNSAKMSSGKASLSGNEVIQGSSGITPWCFPVLETIKQWNKGLLRMFHSPRDPCRQRILVWNSGGLRCPEGHGDPNLSFAPLVPHLYPTHQFNFLEWGVLVASVPV